MLCQSYMVAVAVSSLKSRYKKQCYFKVTRAPVSPMFECHLKSTFEFMANFVTQLPASVTRPHLLSANMI